ncbi:MAG: hypothetical protein MUQ32_13495 [Chloroflexi bacterium]|nr:hypothetical protein [Chloroflexota bacterium]
MRRGPAALAIAIVDIVGYGILAIATSADTGSDPVSTLMFGGAIAAFSLMGALLIRRVPANPIGALLLGVGSAQTAGIALLVYGGTGGSAVPPWPGSAIVSALGDVWYTAPFVIALVGIPLVFPDGRLASPRFRWVVRAIVAGLVSMVLAGLAPLVPGLTDVETLVSVLIVASLLAIAFGFGGAGVAIWVRFRRGDPVQRQQLKWLLADAGVAAIAFPLAMVSGPSEAPLALAFWAIGFLAYLGLPVAIGIAVLRYRLYEIDRLVSRTIGYLIVTATLAFVFVGGILLFELVLTPLTGGNTLGVAASTLIAATLFGPLRRRVQAVVDRRFNRSRYDAERAVAAFVAQLRDDVDLETVSADVLGVVNRTVAPASVGLWIRQSGVEK